MDGPRVCLRLRIFFESGALYQRPLLALSHFLEDQMMMAPPPVRFFRVLGPIPSGLLPWFCFFLRSKFTDLASSTSSESPPLPSVRVRLFAWSPVPADWCDAFCRTDSIGLCVATVFLPRDFADRHFFSRPSSLVFVFAVRIPVFLGSPRAADPGSPRVSLLFLFIPHARFPDTVAGKRTHDFP